MSPPDPRRADPAPRSGADYATVPALRRSGTSQSPPWARSRTRPRRRSPRPPTRPCLPARASPWHYCSQSPGAFLFVFPSTTNHEAPGPFPRSGNQPCHLTTTTLHNEEPDTVGAAPWTPPLAVVEQVAEDHRDIAVDSGVGDRHTEFNRAHDRVGNNSSSRGRRLGHRAPRQVGDTA